MCITTSQPTRKQFGPSTLFALAFTICNSWTSVSGTLQLALYEGGVPALVYGIIAATLIFICIGASLAELASVYPTAGGQYHYASILAPAGWERGLSYTAGLVTVFSWIGICAAIAMIPSQYITALASVYHPTYVAQRWQVFLIYEGLVLIGLLAGVLLLKRFAWLHIVGVVETFSLFLVNFICYLARSKPKASNEVIWVDYTDVTGWPDGISFLAGMSSLCFMYCGLDAATHMAEECTGPKRTVPKIIMATIAMGFIAGFSYTMAVVYAIPDPEALINSQGYLPLNVQIMGWRSLPMATGITCAMIVMAISILSAAQETASRLTWVFARDHGFICSEILMTIHPTLQVPLYASLATWAIVSLCGVLYVISDTAFNALLGSAVTFQQISYMIPIALLLYQRRSAELLPPERPFRLPGVLGWLVNILTVVFTVVVAVFSNFPLAVPATSESMNYACVVVVIALVIALVNWWFHAKNQYGAPVHNMAAMLAD
ncbi:hypothetical protein M409DRAFT_66198 [Zasmidium cellare ATCC 36951]|uniref:Amino acid permease/ SLC12A domain-containing protein n=1 Tax=Zasmidium cellare ATCC 36951 TaxID=1080233 RepID=A0A6A6CN07_ZASCE|nr:uncharacterized protein M409DRAFT_66198 [Zasmidium cellare ATCC 36951]KAF2167149.1 hypothetical protein M409DRAFT_66198 [Zasmidium cellare ATCC 36951]